MNDTLDTLIEILTHSIKKNGDKPLTLSHALAILKKAQRDRDREDFEDLVGMGHDD